MKRLLIIIAVVFVALPLWAQETPAPMPPNYERIQKETKRWFGEYNYRKLVKRFERCDTSMTIDHIRCLYYGAAMRGDTAYTITAQRSWWQRVEMIQAVWSSGNGSDTLPFHVASYADARFMRDDTGDSNVHCMLMGKPLWRKSVEPLAHLSEKSAKEMFGEMDSVAMVRLGVLPTAEQRRLFKLVANAEPHAKELLRSSYEGVPNSCLWLDLELAELNHWGTRSYEQHLDRHRGDTSVLLAEYYLRMAKEALENADNYNESSRYQDIVGWCDTICRFWPSSIVAQHAEALRERVMTGEVRLKDVYRPYVVPYAANEWALGTVWHRLTKKVWLRLTPMDTLEREHPKVLKEWSMTVSEHPDLQYHEAYVYLPPMPTGHYLLWASADSLFNYYDVQEVIFSDHYLMADQVGRGVVMDSRTGKPVKGFKVYMQNKGNTVASVRTDRHGYFAFDVPEEADHYNQYKLYAPYKGLDLARGMYVYPMALEHFVLDTTRVEDEWDDDEDEEDDEVLDVDSLAKIAQDYRLYYDSATCDSLWFCYGYFHWDGKTHYLPAVEAELTVERLQVPSVHRLNHMMLSRDGEQTIDSAEFERRFPGFAYSPSINRTDDWPVAELVGVWRQHFEAAENHAFAMPPLEAAGVYRVTIKVGEEETHATLCHGRWPMTGSHIDAWREGSGVLAVGDTLRVHLASWQKDVRAVALLMVNGRVTDCRKVRLGGEECVLEYPLGDVEGIVIWKVASVWHGEPSNGEIKVAVGPRAVDYVKHFNDYWFYMERHLMDWTRYYGVQRLRHAPLPSYPDRQQFIPSVCRYLELRLVPICHIYDPGEYNRWRLISYCELLRCR